LVGVTWPGGITATLAETELAPDCAETVTAIPCEAEGAVYFPLESIVPTFALPPGVPLTDQARPELCPATLAVNEMD